MRLMIFGTFDDLHPGHAYVFMEALKRGDVWAVVARDSNVLKIKGRASMQSEDERTAAIAATFPTVHVILGDATDFLQPVHDVQPDLILLGYDQKLPPHVTEEDIGVPIERLPAFHPEMYKSSLHRKK